MGLYAEFTPEDLGYKLEFNNDKYMITVEVDYSEALEECSKTFLETAKQKVPVDTGFLRSTINSEYSDISVNFEATAEYAEFVEYGTWKQLAQPYFRPALEEALQIFITLANQIQDEAEEEFYSEIEAAQMEEIAAQAAGNSGGFSLGSIFATVGLFLFLFPIIVNLYGIVQTIKGTTMEDRRGSAVKGITGALIYNIKEIAENLIQIIEI